MTEERTPYLVPELLAAAEPMLKLAKFADPAGQWARAKALKLLEDKGVETIIASRQVDINSMECLLTEHAALEEFKRVFLTNPNRRFEFDSGYCDESPSGRIYEWRAATAEELAEAQHIVDTIPDRPLAAMRKQRAKEGKVDTIQWRRPVPFDLSPAQTYDGKFHDMSPEESK